jgi:uncharacterized integral membrane protein
MSSLNSSIIHKGRTGEAMSETGIGPESDATTSDDSSTNQIGKAESEARANRPRRTRRSRPDAEHFRHTRTSAVWAAVFVAVLFGVALVDFIAQNTHDVRVNFFTVSGRMPGAVALLAAALAGAVVVLAVGVGRVAQLRLNIRRQRRHAAPANGAPVRDDERTVPRADEDSSGRS